MWQAHDAAAVPAPVTSPLAHEAKLQPGYASLSEPASHVPPPLYPGTQAQADLSAAITPFAHATAVQAGYASDASASQLPPPVYPTSHAHDARLVPAPLITPFAHDTALHDGYAPAASCSQLPPPAYPGKHAQLDLSASMTPFEHVASTHVGGTVVESKANPVWHEPQWSA